MSAATPVMFSACSGLGSHPELHSAALLSGYVLTYVRMFSRVLMLTCVARDINVQVSLWFAAAQKSVKITQQSEGCDHGQKGRGWKTEKQSAAFLLAGV